MQLDLLLQRLAISRLRNMPHQEVAMNISMDPEELSAFEINLRQEFAAAYKAELGDFDAASIRLGWDVNTSRVLQQIYHLVPPAAFNRSMSRSKAKEKTREFFLAKPRRAPLTPARVQSIAYAYLTLQSQNESVSIREVEKKSKVRYEDCRYVLQELGLPIQRHRHKLTEREAEAIRASPFTKKDVVAFTGISLVTLNRYASQFAFPNDRNAYLFVSGPVLDKWSRLHYRDASQIYAHADAGVSTKDLANRVRKHPLVVNHALNNRPLIEKPIVTFFQQFHNVPQHDKPYWNNIVDSPAAEVKAVVA